jgi:hypothetical protein
MPFTLIKAALKKGQKPFLKQSFATRNMFRLPSTVLTETHEFEEFRSKLKRYNALHHWQQSDIHPCFAQVLGLSLQMKLLLQSDSPFPLLGLVHLHNKINQLEALRPGLIELSCSFGEVSFHDKGILFEVIVRATQENEICIEATGGYLYRISNESSKQASKTNSSSISETVGLAESKSSKIDHRETLKTNTGRNYAKVSGDFNPIHLYTWSAKFLGFKRHIAHGMHTLALTTSFLRNTGFIGDRGIIDCQFKGPAALPCQLNVTVNKDSSFDESLHFYANTDDNAASNGKVLTGCFRCI